MGEAVDLIVKRRVGEDYVPPKGGKAFSGSGHRLGAPVPNLVPGSSSMPGSFQSDAAPAPSSSDGSEREALATKFEVDQTQPTTSVQIRLADGTRYA